MCIIISQPKNNSPLCDIFFYKSKKFLSQQINTGTSQQTIPNGTSFIVLSTFFFAVLFIIILVGDISEIN